MNLLTDNPIKNIQDDKFGFHPYAKLLSETILSTEELPFCIGIFGAWGTGKTSLMKMIESYTCQNKVKTIWFNPWKYDQKEDLWHALIQTILYKIAEDNENSNLEKTAKELAKHTTWFFLKKGISSITSNIISEESIEKIKEAITSQDEIHYRHVNHFEEDFALVVDEYTQNGKLIVFIDDLDRCIPENAITVLESLKLFIGSARCVFVLGMDQYIVEQGIKNRYGNKIEMSGRDYLEKIIQAPFFLPPVSFRKLREAFSVEKTANYDNCLWKLVEFGFSGNPRKTKRFVNSYYFLNEIIKLPERHNDIDLKNMNIQNIDMKKEFQKFYIGKLLILQMEHTQFYDYLIFHPETWEKYELKLIEADDLQTRNDILREDDKLNNFWEDLRLRSFMKNTSKKHNRIFPQPPIASIVEPLTKMISLVEQSNVLS